MKRELLEQLREDYPRTMICENLELARSTAYYPAVVTPPDPVLDAAIERIGTAYPTYGSRRVTFELRRAPYAIEVGRRRVAGRMTALGLTQRPHKRRVQTTDSRHDFPRYPNLVRELEIVRPDQVWVSDLMYVRLRNDWIYLAIVMDVFTRCLRGWHLSASLATDLTVGALHLALAQGRPQIHHSDQGVQYAADEYTRRLQALGIAISMAEVGHSQQNPFAERVIRTIKEEEVYLSDYRDLHDAREQIGRFINSVYQLKRICEARSVLATSFGHSSLGYLTPTEFEAQWRRAHGSSEVQI